MDIEKARKLLGKESTKYSNDQILDFIETAKLLSDIAIEQIQKMTPEEIKKFKKS